MKLFVTGAKGQVGIELMRQGAARHEMIGMTHESLEITDSARVTETIMAEMPDVVINAAAYTAVDRAETDSDTCFAVNRDGAKNLAQACSLARVPLIHISTDYLFDGSKSGAYVETDPISPVGVYGRSKAEGEELVREICTEYIILRTSWVFSAHGNNFVKTMLRLGAEREELGVVADQYGKPTAAAELARIVLDILASLDDHWGVYHLAQPEVASWHDFAEAIFTEARKQGFSLDLDRLNAIATTDYPTSAKRPANSELCTKRLESTFGVAILPWQESLAEVIRELKRV